MPYMRKRRGTDGNYSVSNEIVFPIVWQITAEDLDTCMHIVEEFEQQPEQNVLLCHEQRRGLRQEQYAIANPHQNLGYELSVAVASLTSRPG